MTKDAEIAQLYAWINELDCAFDCPSRYLTLHTDTGVVEKPPCECIRSKAKKLRLSQKS